MIVTIVASQVVEAVLRANIMIGAAILLVLGLRRIVRRLFGAEIAYALWLVVPLAALGALAPARTRIVAAALAATTSQTQTTGPFADLLHAASRYSLALNLWLTGAILAAAALLWGQLRFLLRERAGRAGPAVVGVISPRFVTPADYATRFTAEERQIIRAHEHAHLSRGDAQVNAAIAAVQVLCWFNPLVHLAARLARHDQELACDASVLRRLPVTRRRYAETLLKTQLGAAALPWAAIGRPPPAIPWRNGSRCCAAPRRERGGAWPAGWRSWPWRFRSAAGPGWPNRSAGSPPPSPRRPAPRTIPCCS
ncbi:MAG TPA: M56 family metallopeptidase [Caulobacteraceae bacterium]|jgi:beta-lactamase regulating signal transducer with metallopeptidase domain|nr:M56 family metallopeptidase [Caulobacteraceae bacterium]